MAFATVAASLMARDGVCTRKASPSTWDCLAGPGWRAWAKSLAEHSTVVTILDHPNVFRNVLVQVLFLTNSKYHCTSCSCLMIATRSEKNPEHSIVQSATKEGQQHTRTMHDKLMESKQNVIITISRHENGLNSINQR